MTCDRVEICLKPTDNNLSWYTIDRSIVKEGKCLRQSCCPGMFAIVTLKIEPYKDTKKRVAAFKNKITEIDYGRGVSSPEESDLQMICSGVILGIEAACLGLESQLAVAKIKVTALKAVVHPVDSHSGAFKIATRSALLEAFKETKLIKI